MPPYNTKQYQTKRANTEQCEFKAAPGPALCYLLVLDEFWHQNVEHSIKSTKNTHQRLKHSPDRCGILEYSLYSAPKLKLQL